MKKRNRSTSANPKVSKPEINPRPFVAHLLRCAVLVLAVYVVYSNSFQSGWVLDNRPIVQLDPRNKQASWENLKLIWSKDYWWPKSDSGGYRPVVSTSYLLNWSVLGNGNHDKESDQVVGFHWINLATHALNTILAYFLVLKLLRRHWTAFVAAALFAVHPIATESVTNIIGRADEFAAASFIGATLLYIRSTEVSGLKRIPWLAAVMALFAFGCFSKESAPAFMAIPLLFDAIYRWGSPEYAVSRFTRILYDCLVYAALLLPFILLLIVRSFVFQDAPAPARIFVDNPMLRFDWNSANSLFANLNNWVLARMTACNVAVKGLWKLIWPVHLSSDYSYNQIPLFGWQLSSAENIEAIIAALLIAGTLVLALWCYKRFKAVSFLIFFFWIAYGPTSNFLVTSPSIMAERFFYLPSFAFLALFAIGVDLLAHRFGATLELDGGSLSRPWPRLAPHAAILMILILFGVRTYNRNFDWRSDMTLAESARKESPRSFRSYQVLAFGYYEIDPTTSLDRSIELGETAVGILEPLPPKENSSRTYLDLGIYYGTKAERTATRNPDGSLLLNDRAHDWLEKSARVLERGVEIDIAANKEFHTGQLARGRTEIPDVGQPGLYLYLGIAYAELGMNERALQAFEYMRHLNPGDPMAYTQIASTQATMGRSDDAVVSLMQGLIVDPRQEEAWRTLMDLYSKINREPIPAIEIVNGEPQLREDNNLVRRHLLLAYQGFLKIAQSSGNRQLVEKAREMAAKSRHLDPKLLDAALQERFERPVPPGPVFHTYGKRISETSATP
jgi:tetratricopeptide (TPR) repeat protein